MGNNLEMMSSLYSLPSLLPHLLKILIKWTAFLVSPGCKDGVRMDFLGLFGLGFFHSPIVGKFDCFNKRISYQSQLFEIPWHWRAWDWRYLKNICILSLFLCPVSSKWFMSEWQRNISYWMSGKLSSVKSELEILELWDTDTQYNT